MLTGQKQMLHNALSDSSFWHLCPSRLSALKSSVTSNSSCGRQNTRGNPLALSNASQTSGHWRVRQWSSGYAEGIPSEYHHLFDLNKKTVLHFEWRLPYVCHPHTHVCCAQVNGKIYAQASTSSTEQADGSWAARILCSQTMLLYTVHITIDSLT